MSWSCRRILLRFQRATRPNTSSKKLRKEDSPTGDQIQDILVKYSKYIVNFTVASQFGNDSVFIILSDPELLRHLEEGSLVLMDGTFGISNTTQTQVYVMGTLVSGHFVPCTYIYMGKRTEIVYREVFSALKVAIPAWSPHHCLLDHEQAAINAFKGVQAASNVFTCYFHLKSSVREWLASSNRKYSTPEEKTRISSLLPMVFDRVVTADTSEGFDMALRGVHEACEACGENGEEFLRYLSTTWGIHGEQARFPRELWAHINRPQWMREFFRTTIVLERSHYALKAALDRKLGLMGTVGFLCEQVQINHARLDRINNGTCSSGSL